jgi:hypothetical protein
MDTAKHIGRYVTSWYGIKDQTLRFTHSGDAVKVDDAHSVNITAAEWTALSNLFKLKQGRDITVPTSAESTKDSLGKLPAVAYKIHRVNDDTFDFIYVGMPGGIRN